MKTFVVDVVIDSKVEKIFMLVQFSWQHQVQPGKIRKMNWWVLSCQGQAIC